MSTKPFYKSKTMWVNGIVALAVVAAFFGVQIAPSDIPMVGEAQPEDVAMAGTGVLAGLNMLLRSVTESAVAIKTAGKV